MARNQDGTPLHGYRESLKDTLSKERYEGKLRTINWKDPYEMRGQFLQAQLFSRHYTHNHMLLRQINHLFPSPSSSIPTLLIQLYNARIAQNIFSNFAKSLNWRRSTELQKPGVLSVLHPGLGLRHFS